MQFVRGVGPVRAKQFALLGVRTVGDLIEHFPFRHELVPKSVPIGSLQEGVTATVVGELRNVRARGGGRAQALAAEVVDGTGRCRVTWFNSPFLTEKLYHGQVVRLTGKVGVYRELASFSNPKLTVIEGSADPMAGDQDRYEPIYPGTGELPSAQIRRIVDGVLHEAAERIVDFLPDAVRRERGLPPRRTAILRYHRPTSPDDTLMARRRLAYDEFLLCQLAVQMSRRRLSGGVTTHPVVTTDEIDRRIRRRFPFTLTPGQDRAIAEIRADLARSEPMNRLLQADVGAGKTAVAVYAALAAIANRRQVAIIAPTEVLAAQHWSKVRQYLEGSAVRTAYLTGATPRSERAAVLAALAAGDMDLVVGTHALLDSDVCFRGLGLVIIDEQHKFGVAQRAALRAKGRAPHALVLTATPIPRTLAMTVFGDLDVSTIDGVLPQRRPVVTRLVPPDRVEQAWGFVRSRLDHGEQAYIVYPLIEESEVLPLKAASVEVERLGRETLGGFRVDLLHGRMAPQEKAEAMARLRSGETQVLVSTTVIEVGVDVPNVTMMVIQHAERYGLSQLHQLRGRVGRGSKQSYCLLFAEAVGEAAMARLNVLCETSDGFRIAEEDLRQRGPGELLGTRQHGIPAFKVADLAQDFALLAQARDDAAAILRGDEQLSAPRHAGLRDELARRYGRTLWLVDVG